LAPYSLKNK